MKLLVITQKKMNNIEFNDQQKEFIIENFKEQLSLVEEEKLTLSATSQMIMEQIISKLEE